MSIFILLFVWRRFHCVYVARLALSAGLLTGALARTRSSRSNNTQCLLRRGRAAVCIVARHAVISPASVQHRVRAASRRPVPPGAGRRRASDQTGPLGRPLCVPVDAASVDSRRFSRGQAGWPARLEQSVLTPDSDLLLASVCVYLCGCTLCACMSVCVHTARVCT